ncbi:MAG: hypothetical protein RJA36_2104 [Pseudomonadota bacterium]|jgi:3,4-dihydroxy 2-butanone 4-phosphate synthase/GTP cyclohydrolase II
MAADNADSMRTAFTVTVDLRHGTTTGISARGRALTVRALADPACGAVVYLRGHEGRGIGLLHKLRAYVLQDTGADTAQANVDLGLPVDARDYATGAQILADLGVGRMRRMTNNPSQYDGVCAFGLEVVERIPLVTVPHRENAAYLRTKRELFGHLLAQADVTV